MIRSVKQVELESRRVVLRVDFNCPVKDGVVVDDTRIRASLPTIRHALNQRAKLVIISHFGRPKGKRVPEASLEPVGLELAKLLNTDVVLADDCVGDGVRKVVSDLYGGRIAMLENVRFHPGEQANDEKFARELAQLGDVYVNDAFSVSHRANASVALVPRFMKERCAGLHMKREIEALRILLGEVKRPYLAILGGAKVSDKIKLIHELLGRVDGLVFGGAMANTFLAARGLDLGRSLVEQDSLVHARGIMEEAKRRSVKLLLPVDLVVAESPDHPLNSVVASTDVGRGMVALDVGPATVASFAAEIGKAGTIFWNGPMGLYEKPPYDTGTIGIAMAVGKSMAYSVVGGGDSVAAIKSKKMESRFDHISTGGGASLEFIEGREMPGVKALEVEE